MSKKIVILSAVALLLAVAVTVVVWFSISIVQRLNPQLNIGSRGYIPEVPEVVLAECSGDKVCMELTDTGEQMIVPSTCNDDTEDVASLESVGWMRCAELGTFDKLMPQ